MSQQQRSAVIQIRAADFQQPGDQEIFLELLDHYSRDPFGGGEPLSEEIRSVLPQRWSEHPGNFTLFAVRDTTQYVGMANCVTSFSTFQARPRINIHDLVVREGSRGLGIGRRLIEAVCDEARRRDANQVTLEVLAGNERAHKLYQRCGFSGIELPARDKTYLFGTLQLSD